MFNAKFRVMNVRTKYISFRVSNIEKQAIALAAKECGLSTSEYSRRAALNMKVTLRFSPEEMKVYKNLHVYHRNFKAISNLVKSDYFKKNDTILLELEELIKLIKGHLEKFEQ
jgi:hypothetical protein